MSKRPVRPPTVRTTFPAVLSVLVVLVGLAVTAAPAAPATHASGATVPLSRVAAGDPGASGDGPTFETPAPRERPRPTGQLFSRAPAAGASAASGDITIVLDAQPDSGQDVGFTGCSAGGCGPFVLDDDADVTHPRELSASGLPPGSYQVTQQEIPGWTLTAIECDTGETVDLGARRATIDLSDAEHATCTFTLAAAAITVVLDAQPDSGEDVGFTGCGP
ncbi:MAG: hypothetical protein KDB35_23840, partial [Acidimicrobiales bacterium]|nr:hypothetical protein [Acidimicrobiales bacterium]